MLGEFISVYLLTLIVFTLSPLRKSFFPIQSNVPYTFAGSRLKYFDFLKGVAVLAVIVIHMVYISIKMLGSTDTLFLFSANNFTRFAIPFFLIISGALSMLKYEKKIDLKKYYTGKFVKIYLPFAFFTMLLIYVHGLDIKNLFSYLVNGKVLVPYYFIILILQLYILFPLLRRLKDSRFFLYFSFFVSLSFFSFEGLNYWGDIILFPKFLFFFVFGMYYRHNLVRHKSDKNKVVYWYFIIFAYAIISLSVPAHYFNFKPFFGVAVLSLLLIYKENIISSLGKVYGFISGMGKNSLWIYLIHFSVLHGMIYVYSLFLKNIYIMFAVVFIVSIPILAIFGRILSTFYDKISYIIWNRKKQVN